MRDTRPAEQAQRGGGSWSAEPVAADSQSAGAPRIDFGSDHYSVEQGGVVTVRVKGRNLQGASEMATRILFNPDKLSLDTAAGEKSVGTIQADSSQPGIVDLTIRNIPQGQQPGEFVLRRSPCAARPRDFPISSSMRQAHPKAETGKRSMLSLDHPKSKSARKLSGSAGTSLIEMVAVLAIFSVLATLAAPYARKSIQREKEFALRETLREVRGAIDRFHEDWQASLGGGKFASLASPDGYPNALDVLVKGVDAAGPAGGRRRYLRAVPQNPFAAGAKLEDQWRLIGYQDDPKSPVRRGKDVYDLRANTPLTALDGTSYAEW